MATSLTDFSISIPTPVVSGAYASEGRRRRITPEAGHALEILGHAIEYLTDEFVQSGAPLSARNSELEAVQLLMGLNRQVYFECPVALTIREKIRGVFHLTKA